MQSVLLIDFTYELRWNHAATYRILDKFDRNRDEKDQGK